MDKKRLPVPVPVGGSALLVIFAVLCLTTFAMMSLATVQANRRLTAASASAVCAYYRTDAQAERTLAQLRGGEIPSNVKVSGTVYTYSAKISDTQKLQVKIQMDGKKYDVLEWKAVSTTNWEPDDSLHVWDGGTTK
jgi:hypothetical protein